MQKGTFLNANTFFIQYFEYGRYTTKVEIFFLEYQVYMYYLCFCLSHVYLKFYFCKTTK
nr:MAG TPA: hypothetical protein [Caudoviricetes sp.]